MKFIGREEQLKRLDRVINTDELTFSLIYGRRRVGKSELVKQAVKIMLKAFIMSASRFQKLVMRQVLVR